MQSSNINQLFSEIEVTLAIANELGLTSDEYNSILTLMGRTPTYTEIGMFSVLWSEHCSYKNSIKLIKTLPRSGKNLLVEAGEENAGLVDIGHGYGIVFKIESHNHPSAVEPFHGAATGIGGVLRDIFTMGARPIAVLNSLRFGEISSDKTNSDRTKFLLKGVVEGASNYANNFGVAGVGGEIYFDDCYQDNPLVNVMAAGIVEVKKTATATASGVGNSVFILGAPTGCDGISGASFASREFDEHTTSTHTNVPTGDPILEKNLLEATLELIDKEVIVAIQDMGAAGLSCSTSEMSAKNGLGMKINLDLAPLRNPKMTAFEIMLSESQERMLAVVEKGKEDAALSICHKWNIPAFNIGEVTGDGFINIWRNNQCVANINAKNLVLGGDAPQNDRETAIPQYITDNNNQNLDKYSSLPATEKDFWTILGSPTIASKKWISNQFDPHLHTNVISTKNDAAIVHLPELHNKGIALCTDVNSRYCYLTPYRGGMAAVCEAARNVACVGAHPVAITNNLNFGNPYDPEVYWQFKEAITGIGDACRTLDLPVTGGNVSFHNESKEKAIFPTPTIGMLGIIEDINNIMSADFKNPGDVIIVIGENKKEIGGSEYLKIIHQQIIGEAPDISADLEKQLIDLILKLIHKKLVTAVHDISEGGIAIALAEMSIQSKILGVKVNIDDTTAGSIFGESQSRVVVTLPQDNIEEFKNIIKHTDLVYKEIGCVLENTFTIENVITTDVSALTEVYENALPTILS